MQSYKSGIYIDKDKLPILVIILSMLFISIIFIFSYVSEQNYYDHTAIDIYNLSTETKDGYINLSWTNPNTDKNSSIELKISANGIAAVTELKPFAASYQFLDGIHGELYTFTVRIKDKNGNFSDGQQKSAMFLDWDNLPELPIVSITTVNGEEPGYVESEKPEGCWGASITGNEYVTGQLLLSENGRTTVHTGMKFRIRGNTSAYSLKRPYKIKLDKAIDLLQRGNEIYCDTDWSLLSCGTDLHTLVGLYVSELCQLEWQPSFKFVNVIINGDWKGCYLLIESVGKGKGRCNISEEGFLIENDAYWWNSDGVYFKTENQIYQLGYTFQYPSSADVTDDTIETIQNYMNDFETALYNNDCTYSEYIDIHSFASWLLVHDIMGSSDGGGTNMYLYKYDFDMDNPTSTKIKMGPAWDFDSSYGTEGEWAAIHRYNFLYSNQLFTFDEFRSAYIDQWAAISDTLSSKVMNYVNELLDSQGEALQDSWILDAKRWNYDIIRLEDEVHQISEWFFSRPDWMNSAISEW